MSLFRIAYNLFTGTIPSSLCQSTALSYINIINNPMECYLSCISSTVNQYVVSGIPACTTGIYSLHNAYIAHIHFLKIISIISTINSTFSISYYYTINKSFNYTYYRISNNISKLYTSLIYTDIIPYSIIFSNRE